MDQGKPPAVGNVPPRPHHGIGNIRPTRRFFGQAGPSGLSDHNREPVMYSIIYLVGLVVVVLAILSLFGLR
jgi:hypothetical protein